MSADLLKKRDIPKNVETKISKMNLCNLRIKALMNNMVNEEGNVEIKPGICKINQKNGNDIKNLQAYLLMKHLEILSKINTIPIILTGDFNSKPSSSIYKGITTGQSFNRFDSEDLKYPKPFINTSKVFTKYPMKSCYKKVF